MSRESEVHPHVPSERAELFSTLDGGSTEYEHLELITALIRCLKPQRILESGTYRGEGTKALAIAIKANGFGELTTVDPSNDGATKMQWGIRITFSRARTWDFLLSHTEPFDFAFFDSMLSVRGNECRLALERGLLKSGAVAVFHDTSKTRTMHGGPDPETRLFWSSFEVIRPRFSQIFEFVLSRGLLIGRVA